MKIGPYTLSNGLIVAPMAGVTDRPFRQLCKQFGAGHAVSEMISADTSLYASNKSSRRSDFNGELAPISAQIAGHDPAMLAAAARYQVQQGAQIIDINMGCPAKKVCNKLAGSALLQDEDLVKRILDSVVNAVGVPVTLKTRLGYLSTHENIVRIAHIAQDSGIQALAIHGRTREQMYTGEARYELIKTVKANSRIPIIANGDIDSPAKAKYVLDYTGADAIMIGRAAQGRPWIFKQIAHYLQTGTQLAPISLTERYQVIEAHLANVYAFYGEYSGCRIARKHIAWYTNGLTNSNTFRQDMYQIDNTHAQADFTLAYLQQLILTET